MWFLNLVLIISLLVFKCVGGAASLRSDQFGHLNGYNQSSTDRQRLKSNWEAVCPAISTWSFIRHGTRFPNDRKVQYMAENLGTLRDYIVAKHEKGKGSLSSSDIEAFKKWTFYFNRAAGHEPHMLTESGHQEMTDLGRRMRLHLPKLLHDADSVAVNVPHTPEQRTRASARSFLTGAFGKKKGANTPLNETGRGDPVLRPYKECPLWLSKVKRARATYFEFTVFQDDEPFVKRVHENLRERLGLDKSDFPEGHALMLYEVCAFETAWLPNTTSPWCSAFTDEDMVVMEYLQDLEFYHKDAHGSHLNYLMTCESLKAVLKQFEQYDLKHGIRSQISNLVKEWGGHQPLSPVSDDFPKKPAATFAFSHAGLMGKLLARLDLFRETEHYLFGKNFDRLGQKRNWKTSHLVPFGANLAFVLHDCGPGAGLQVSLYLNERQVVPPFCAGVERNGLCPLQQYQNHLNPGYCLLKSICDQEKTELPSYTVLSAVGATAGISKYLGVW